MKSSSSRSWRTNGRRALLLLLAGVLGCTPTAGKSAYRVLLPRLKADPVSLACVINAMPATCVLLEQEDYRSLVRELKSACLALGQTAKDCQAE